jgi:CTP-dependent riboflavin kinase
MTWRTKNSKRIYETKSWFFKRLNKIDKSLPNIIRRRKEKTQINRIRVEKGTITKNTNKIQRLIRGYFENLYSNKLD